MTLPVTLLNSIIQSDLVSLGVGLRIDDSLDSLQGLLSSGIHAIILLDLDAHLVQRISDVLALDAICRSRSERTVPERRRGRRPETSLPFS